MQSAFVFKNPSNNKHVEVLLRNYMGKHFQSVLKPLNLMLYFCCSTKCVIRDNFITPKNRKSIIISVVGTILFCINYMFKFRRQDFSNNPHLNEFFQSVSAFDVFFYSTGLIVNLVSTINQSPNFVAMILKIRDVDQVLHDNEALRKLKIGNWIVLGLLLQAYSSNLIYFITLKMTPVYIVAVAILWCFDANLLYLIGIVCLLRNKLELWTKEIKKYTNGLTNFGEVNDEATRLKVINSYLDILDAYNIFKKVFENMIFFHTVETFVHDLIYVKMTIEVVKHSPNTKFFFFDPSSMSTLTGWMLKNLGLQATVSVQCEKYYAAVSNARTACILFMKSGRCSSEERRACKNTFRAHAASYAAFSARALYRVDARLPLRLFALIANYTVVILQFAFMR